ncbi:MAG TPA: tetratricopeptide repeat protein, partial [Pseudonocardiaceae bacterium]
DDLGYIYELERNYDLAADCYEKCLEIYRRIGTSSLVDTLESLARGVCRAGKGRSGPVRGRGSTETQERVRGFLRNRSELVRAGGRRQPARFMIPGRFLGLVVSVGQRV